jgi:hypothetical protein
MRTLIGVVFGAIAVGVLLIAYALFNPRTAAADSYQLTQPALVNERISLDGDSRVSATPLLQIRCEPGQRAIIRQAAGTAAAECVDDGNAVPRATIARPANTVVTYPAETYSAPRRAPVARVAKTSSRNWKKTAMVIGGSSAAGAGVGGIFGGKKGALIGAAIGGGAGTLFEVAK